MRAFGLCVLPPSALITGICIHNVADDSFASTQLNTFSSFSSLRVGAAVLVEAICMCLGSDLVAGVQYIDATPLGQALPWLNPHRVPWLWSGIMALTDVHLPCQKENRTILLSCFCCNVARIVQHGTNTVRTELYNILFINCHVSSKNDL